MTISIDQIASLEARVWEALRTGDARLDAEILAECFLGVYPTGFATRAQHCGFLKDGPTVARYELRTPKLMVLSEDLVLLSYLAVWSRMKGGREQPLEQMYISSLWQRTSGKWLNIFSQDTPAAS